MNATANISLPKLFHQDSMLLFSVTNNLSRVNAKCLANFLCYSFCDKERLLVWTKLYSFDSSAYTVNVLCFVRLLMLYVLVGNIVSKMKWRYKKFN